MVVTSRYFEQEFVEIIPNLWIGGKYTLSYLLEDEAIDTIVPLDSLDSSIWDSGVNYEICYFPTQDYGVLPLEREKEVVNLIVSRLKDGKKVALLCHGGIGRTSYIASLVIRTIGVTIRHRNGVIGFLRAKYNSNAVETVEQMERIVEPENYWYWKNRIVSSNYYFETTSLLDGYKK